MAIKIFGSILLAHMPCLMPLTFSITAKPFTRQNENEIENFPYVNITHRMRFDAVHPKCMHPLSFSTVIANSLFKAFG